MSLEFCSECYDLPGVREGYAFVDNVDSKGNREYNIYTLDNWKDLPHLYMIPI